MKRIETFSSRLHRLLDMRDITAAELSRLSGVSKSSISHYLRGDWEGKQDTVYAIARAMSVNESWLMGYDAPMERTTSRTETSRGDDAEREGTASAAGELLSSDERKHLEVLRSMNDEGREKVYEFAQLLADSGAYTKTSGDQHNRVVETA